MASRGRLALAKSENPRPGVDPRRGVEAEVSVSRIMPPKEAAKGKLAADLIGDNPRFNPIHHRSASLAKEVPRPRVNQGRGFGWVERRRLGRQAPKGILHLSGTVRRAANCHGVPSPAFGTRIVECPTASASPRLGPFL